MEVSFTTVRPLACLRARWLVYRPPPRTFTPPHPSHNPTRPNPPHPAPPAGYSFKLESANLERMFLHASPKAPYSTLNDPDNDELAKCLRTGLPCEVNISAAFSTFSIHKYIQPSDDDRKGHPIGAPLRFYHSQAESFLQASSDPDKGKGGSRERPSASAGKKKVSRWGSIKSKVGPKVGVKVEGGGGDGADGGWGGLMSQVTSQASTGADETKEVEEATGADQPVMLPGHIPYLKRVPHTEGHDVDPSNPACQSSKGVWVFENLSRSVGGSVRWMAPVRIRHYVR